MNYNIPDMESFRQLMGVIKHDDLRKKVIRLRKKGAKIKKIAKRLEITTDEVRQICGEKR